MASFTIPTVFTATDKFSRPVIGMSKTVEGFVNKAEVGLARSERMFRKITPAISETSKQLLSFASTAAVATAILGTGKFAFDSLTQYEDALADFRTIVSDLSDKDFAKFEDKIESVGNTTGASVIQVAQSFEKIAGLNSKFGETADGLGQVSEASIVLGRAAKMDFGVAAENLVGIMNQFSLGAEQADRTINVLAAGTAVGASSITQTSEAFVNFGSVAKTSNITLEQSVGLVETLGKYSLFGAEAGTKLRGSVLKLKDAQLGYKSGQFQINDALEEAKEKMDKLGTAKEKDAFLSKTFGVENITAGSILLNNIDTYKDFTNRVTGTTEAHKAAEIQMQTFSAMVEKVKNKFINWVTTSDSAKNAMNKLKKVLKFVADNLDTIFTVVKWVIGAFVVWKGIIWATRAALWALRVLVGAQFLYDMIKLQAATTGVTFLQAAWAIVTTSCTSAMAALNAVMLANPIGVFIVGVVILIALVIVVTKKWNEWGAALSLFMGPLGKIISLVQSFRRNWDMIKKSFSEGGILSGIKAIGKTIFDAILQPLQQLFGLIAKWTDADWAKSAADEIGKFRNEMGVNVTTDENGKPLSGKPAIDAKEVGRDSFVQRITESVKQQITLTVKADPGTEVKGDGGLFGVMPFMTSTMNLNKK